MINFYLNPSASENVWQSIDLFIGMIKIFVFKWNFFFFPRSLNNTKSYRSIYIIYERFADD